MSIGPPKATGTVRWVGPVLLFAVVGSTWVSPLFRDLVIGDETKYSRVVEQMRETGSWLVLRLEGEDWGHKPPLHFWILAAASRMFGLESIWTFVVPSLLAFIVLVAFVAAGQRRLFGRGETTAALLFATFWLAWGLGQSARMDVLFVVCLTAAAVEVFQELDDRSSHSLGAAGAWTGIAVLLRGPIALVIVVILFAIESMRRRRAARFRDLAALGVAVAIPLAWLVPAATAAGGAYARELLVRQTLDRALRSWVHAEPPWYYLLRFPLTFFPWFAVIVVAAVAAVRIAKKRDRHAAMFCLSWFAAVFVPFSLISGKLDVYMLPAMVPAAMLGGWLFEVDDPRWQRRAVAAEMVALGLLGSAFVAALTARTWLAPLGLPEEALLEDSRIRLFVAAGTIASLVGLVLVVAWRRFPQRATCVTGATALLPLLLFVTIAMPALRDSIGTRPLVRTIERARVAPEDVALYWTPHLWERGMDPSVHRVRYVTARTFGEPALLITRRDKAGELGDRLVRFERIESLRLLGKDYDVYRRIGNR